MLGSEIRVVDRSGRELTSVGQTMLTASREFQVMVKPIGAVCNLDCQYCYYLRKKGSLSQA